MSMFDERERAFEAKWAHDEEMQFRILVKRNELLGRWAGAELGLADAALEQYVSALIAMGLKSSDIAALYAKLRADLGAGHSDAVILGKMDDFLQAATLEAGLELARALEEGAPHAAGSGRADFSHILQGGSGVAMHALDRTRREKES